MYIVTNYVQIGLFFKSQAFLSSIDSRNLYRKWISFELKQEIIMGNVPSLRAFITPSMNLTDPSTIKELSLSDHSHQEYIDQIILSRTKASWFSQARWELMLITHTKKSLVLESVGEKALMAKKKSYKPAGEIVRQVQAIPFFTVKKVRKLFEKGVKKIGENDYEVNELYKFLDDVSGESVIKIVEEMVSLIVEDSVFVKNAQEEEQILLAYSMRYRVFKLIKYLESLKISHEYIYQVIERVKKTRPRRMFYDVCVELLEGTEKKKLFLRQFKNL